MSSIVSWLELRMIALRCGYTFRVLLGCAALSLSAFPQPVPNCPAISTQQLVQKLDQKNLSRAEALPEYRSTRVYKLTYHGFLGSRKAEMVVDMVFTPPSTKTFVIRSQSGSKLLLDRVLKKLLEEEKLAFEPANQKRTALTESNYTFTLLGCDSTNRGPAYEVKVEPKQDTKYLYRGKIWIDPTEFSVVRIAAEPAKNPSFWIKKTDIEQLYGKFDNFWLPVRNHSVTPIRLGGRAELTIDYQNYQWTSVAGLQP